MSNNYNAVVVELNGVHKHSNADRLQCVNIFGNNVIVGLDAKDGDVGLFFPIESQIGKEFAEANDLIRRRDENGKTCGGMFDQNRRVRAQTLRGERSMGFFIPIESLNKLENVLDTDIASIKVGDEFEMFCGYEISKKYVVPTKQVQQPSGKQGKQAKKQAEKSKVVDGQFKFHFDTAQLGRNLQKIGPEDLISITWKFHGTSGITSHVLTTKKLKWCERIAKKLGLNIVDKHYDYVYASRKVIKGVEGNFEDKREMNHFYGYDLWGEVGKERFFNKLHKGETCYYEIVGYLPNGNFIQKNHDYGCDQGQYEVYVYRITQTNEDGIVTELPWHQVRHRVTEIGVKTVPEIYYGKAIDLHDEWWNFPEPNNWNENLLNYLQTKYVYDQDSQFCKNTVPEEGVVVRVERGDGVENFKLKSFAHYGFESKQLDSGEADIESEQSEEE